jgi:pimeloyl-ACP methyl ester carboxylesterase
VLPSLFSGTVPQHVADGFGASIAGFHPAGLRSMAEAFAEADVTDSLSSISIPTLPRYGGEDVRDPGAVREAIHDAIPGSQLVVLDGVGHVGTLEAPERINEEIRSFLDRVPI